jgi:hypothetical protein
LSATPYKSVSWADNEPIFTSKLNTMTNNDQWLFENTPRMVYSSYGGAGKRSSQLKIAAGVLTVGANGQNVQTARQLFGSFFSTACKPVVVTSLAHQGEVRLHWGIKGISTTYVDSRGFDVLMGADVTGKWTHMTKTFWIHWIAVGF